MTRGARIWAGTAVFVAVVFAGFLVGRAGGSEGADLRVTPPDVSLLEVAIVSPGSGIGLPGGSPVEVQVATRSTDAIAMVELWANGLRVGQEPVEGPAARFQRSFMWHPSAPGFYSLRARAIVDGGGARDSDSVWVVVDSVGASGQVLDADNDVVVVPAVALGGIGPPPSAADLAQAAAPSAYAAPPVPGPEAAVDPATPFGGGQGGGLPPAGSGTPPAAPQLAGEAAGCVAQIYVIDLSDDEQGFRIHRDSLVDGDPGPVIEIGPGDSGNAIGVQNQVPVGAVYSYVAESFNEHGSLGLSNPVTLDLAAAGCDPPEPPPIVALLPESLPLPEGFDPPGGDDDPGGPGGAIDPAVASKLPIQAYCYVGSAGSPWLRYPSVDFMEVDDEGGIDAAGLEAVVTSIDVPAPSGTWDCWGWANGALTRIGAFDFPAGEQAPGTPDALTFGAAGVSKVPAGLLPGTSLDPAAVPAIDFTYDPVVVDPTLAAPRLFHSIDTLDCLLNRPAGEDGYDFCHPGHWTWIPFKDTSHPDFIPIEGHAHSYLYWDLDDPAGCQAGTGCVPPGDFTVFPHSVVEAGFRVYDLHASDTEPVATLPLGSSGFVPFSMGCGAARAFEVRTFVTTTEPMTFESRSPLSFRAFHEPCSALDEVVILVAFDTLVLEGVDDGLFAEPDLEVYGSFSARGLGAQDYPNSGGGFEIAHDTWHHYTSAEWRPSFTCDLETIDLVGQQEVANYGGCPHPVGNGATPFWTFPMRCVGALYHEKQCAGHTTTTGVHPDNGRVYLDIDDGVDVIVVRIDLWDYDHASDDDPVCQGTIEITKQPGQSWSDLYGEGFSIAQAHNGSAACTVIGHLAAPD